MNSPVTEEELHAYVDGELRRRPRAPRSSNGSPRIPRMPRASPPGARRPMRSARATARSQASRCRRVSTCRRSRARGRKWSRLAAAAVLAAFLLGGGAGWFGRGVVEGAGPTRAVTIEAFEAHRLYIGEVRHPIEVKAGESHLNRWLSRRVGYEMPTPNLDPFGLKLLGGRLLPGNAGRAAALYMYEGATGERFTIYSRRDQAPQSALRYRASGPIGSVFWVEDEVAFVVSGPADRARLQKVAEAVYEQIEKRQQTGALLRLYLAER